MMNTARFRVLSALFLVIYLSLKGQSAMTEELTHQQQSVAMELNKPISIAVGSLRTERSCNRQVRS